MVVTFYKNEKMFLFNSCYIMYIGSAFDLKAYFVYGRERRSKRIMWHVAIGFVFTLHWFDDCNDLIVWFIISWGGAL